MNAYCQVTSPLMLLATLVAVVYLINAVIARLGLVPRVRRVYRHQNR